MPWQSEEHQNFSEGIDRRMAITNPEYPDGACWDLLNAIYLRDSLDPEKMRGSVQLGTTALGGKVTGLIDYDEGARLIATAQDGTIHEYNPAAGTPDWSQATGGSGFNTAEDTRWSGTMFYGGSSTADLLILTNGVNAPQKYTSGAGVSALGGSPPATGNYPVAFIGRLWMASGDTLFYSATNDAEDFSGADAGNIRVDRGSGEITGLYIFSGELLIFKRMKIYRILPTNNLTEVAVRRVSSTIGTVSHYTLQEVALGLRRLNALMFLSENGVQALLPTDRTGGYAVQNVSGKIKPILDRRHLPSQGISWGTFNEDRAEYYLQYVTSSTTPSTPSEGVICNLAREDKPVRWSRHDYANLTAGTMFESSGQEIQVAGDISGKVYQFHSGDARNGADDYTGRVVTKAYTQGRIDRMKQYGRVFVDLEAEGSYAITVNAHIGRRGLPTPRFSSHSVSDFGVVDGWGEGLFGVAQWGGTIGTTGKHIRLSTQGRGQFLRLQIETSVQDRWFKLNGVVIESSLGARALVA